MIAQNLRPGPAESRPFFEALLPEGTVREQIAGQLKLAASDSFGLLAELGRDCAGALQIRGGDDVSEPPSVRWLDDGELDALVEELPRHPLGIHGDERHLRLSLAGVQHKAVLVRDKSGRFGKPLDGMASRRRDGACPPTVGSRTCSIDTPPGPASIDSPAHRRPSSIF